MSVMIPDLNGPLIAASSILKLPSGFDDPTFWALAGLIIFLAILVFLKVPGQMAAALDARAEAIKTELDEAKRLREDAQQLLSQYERRQKEAEQEAEEIVAQAKAEADRFAENARTELRERLIRRAQAAERKIEQAEAEALRDVRAHAADLAARTAAAAIAASDDQAAQARLITDGVDELKRRFS